MDTTLRSLGILLTVAAGACIVLTLTGECDLLIAVPGLAFVGIVFLALGAILGRVMRIESLLTSRTDRISTNLGDFEKLGNDVEGEAMCVGCHRMAPRAGLYYHKSLDVYYHSECLTRDRSL